MWFQTSARGTVRQTSSQQLRNLDFQQSRVEEDRNSRVILFVLDFQCRWMTGRWASHTSAQEDSYRAKGNENDCGCGSWSWWNLGSRTSLQALSFYMKGLGRSYRRCENTSIRPMNNQCLNANARLVHCGTLGWFMSVIILDPQTANLGEWEVTASPGLLNARIMTSAAPQHTVSNAQGHNTTCKLLSLKSWSTIGQHIAWTCAGS